MSVYRSNGSGLTASDYVAMASAIGKGNPVSKATRNRGLPAGSRRVQSSKRQHGALTTSASDRTLGRSAYRFRATAAERSEHDAVNVDRPTAEYVAYNGPNSATGGSFRLTCTTAEREYTASKSADLVAVPFEIRADHLRFGMRTGSDISVSDPRPIASPATIDALETLNDRRGTATPRDITTATD